MNLLDRADALAQQLAGHAAEGEALRRLPDDVAALIAASGLPRLLLPAECGGHEADVATFMGVLERLAQADAAAAWCTMIGATSGVIGAYLPAAAAQALFGGRPDLMLAGVYAPRGRASRQPDGCWLVEGRWAWGSGAQHADFVIVGCLEQGADRPRVLSAVVPRRDVHLLDNWHSLGLKGTGSGEFEIAGALVPADHVACLAADAPPARTLYRFPVFGLLAVGIAAVSCGVARQSIEAFLALAAAKVPQGSRRVLAERAVVHDAAARCEAQARAARAGLREAIGAAWAAAEQGEPIPLALRRNLRLACTHAAHTAAAVTERLFTLAGGDVVFEGSELQRAWRDAHVATQHLMVADPTWELAGRHMMGQPVDASMF